jgi:hypothetical protein
MQQCHQCDMVKRGLKAFRLERFKIISSYQKTTSGQITLSSGILHWFWGGVGATLGQNRS